MYKRFVFIICILLITLTFTACGSGTGSGNENSNQNTRYGVKDDIMDKGPVKGGTLNVFSTQPDTLNPLLTNNAYVRDFLNLIFDSLIIIDKDQKPLPNLAKSWEFSDSGYSLTIKLNENIYWHNNLPLSAEDVEFTIMLLKDKTLGSVYGNNVENIEACEIVDNNTVKLNFKRVNYLSVNSLNFPIIPKHYFLNIDIKDKSVQSNMKPVGTGPYKFVSFSDNELRMIVNTKWWKAEANGQNALTLPYISEVCVKIYPSVKEAINAFNKNETDIVSIEPGQYSAYSGRTDMVVKKYISRYFDFLAFNLARPATGDKAVRQAISYALDRYKLINDAIPGEAMVADFPLSPEAWLSEVRNNAQVSDKTKAREILYINNWRESNGVIYKYIDNNYTPLTLELLCNEDNEARLRVAQRISDQLKEIGITVNIKKVSWEDEMKQIDQKKYDMVLIGSRVNSVPDLSFLYATDLSSSKIQGNSAKNISGYSNEKVDEYLKNAINTNNAEDIRSYIQSAKDIINDEVPYLGLYFKYDTTLFSKRIRGDINPYAWNRYNDISKWYIPQG